VSTTHPRAAIYVRLSEDKHQTGDNVADQERAARKIAADLGAVVAEVYDDNDRVASDPRRKPRPAFEQMLTDAEAGRFDMLIVRHADRLYRTPYDQGRITEAFTPRRIVIHQEWGGPLDLSTPTGGLNAGIMAQVALYETLHKIERQQAHNRQRATQGKPPEGGAVPFGYTRKKKGKGEVALHVEKRQAAMVKSAHRALLRGASLGSVIKRWNDSGVRAPRGGRWSYSTVRGVLTRPLNAGLVLHDGHILPGVTGTWTALVTEEEHRAVVALLSDPSRRTTDGNGRKHLLAGIACCESCGRPMKSGHTSSRGKKSMLYRCVNPACTAKVHVAREQANAEVERRFLAERGHLKVYRLVSVDTKTDALADIEARIAGLSARLGDDDADMAALFARIGELKAQRAKVRDGASLPKIEKGTVAGEWAKGDLNTRRELLTSHITRGGLRIARRGRVNHRFDPERVSIEWADILVTEGPVTFTPDEGEDLGSIPVA
jgi:site-specific DNA recombinase